MTTVFQLSIVHGLFPHLLFTPILTCMNITVTDQRTNKGSRTRITV